MVRWLQISGIKLISVAQCFSQVRFAEAVLARKVCNGASHPECAVQAARREFETFGGRDQKIAVGIGEPGVRVQRGCHQLCIGAALPRPRRCACLFDAPTHLGTRFTRLVLRGQLTYRCPVDMNLHIDAVQ